MQNMVFITQKVSSMGGYCHALPQKKRKKKMFSCLIVALEPLFHTPHITFRKCERENFCILKNISHNSIYFFLVEKKYIMSPDVSKRDDGYVYRKTGIQVFFFSFFFSFFGINKTIY